MPPPPATAYSDNTPAAGEKRVKGFPTSLYGGSNFATPLPRTSSGIVPPPVGSLQLGTSKRSAPGHMAPVAFATQFAATQPPPASALPSIHQPRPPLSSSGFGAPHGGMTPFRSSADLSFSSYKTPMGRPPPVDTPVPPPAPARREQPAAATGPPQILRQTLRPGGGQKARPGDMLDVSYVGWLASASPLQPFDQGEHLLFTLGSADVIPGWDHGLAGTLEGEVCMCM